MLEIKVYRVEEDDCIDGEIKTSFKIKGDFEDLMNELVLVFLNGIDSIIYPLREDNVPKKIIDDLEISIVATFLTMFFAEKMGKECDDEFTDFISSEILDFLFKNTEPEGVADGTEK